MHGFVPKPRNAKAFQFKAPHSEDSPNFICNPTFKVPDEDPSVAVSLISSLKACAKNRDLLEGSNLHRDIVAKGFLQKNVYVGNTLVSTYAKCGALEKAREVFDELPFHNVSSWNAIIAGHAQNGHDAEALAFYEQMQAKGFSPDVLTYVVILKACGGIGALDKGKEIHSQIAREHLLPKHVMVANALIDMYVKCGALEKAQEVFDVLPGRNIISWTTLIAGYAQQGCGKIAVTLFEQMQSRGFSPNEFTFACILKACGSMKDLVKGLQIHAQILREGSLGRDTGVANSLVDMYAKCGALEKAKDLLHHLPIQNIVSWTALIAGYEQYGHGEEALSCFEQMQLRGFHPDVVAYACTLKACGCIGALVKGEEIHTQLVKERLVEKHINIANALVDMYAKCGALGKAQEVFQRIQSPDAACWNALITGYAQHGYGKEALDSFLQMQRVGFTADVETVVCLLKACGSLGNAHKGQEIHAQIYRERLMEKNIEVGNALIDMYSKCDALEKAQDVFDDLSARDVISWTELISGYALHGHAEEALTCLEQMQLAGFLPNAVVFVYALKACESIGAACRGQELHADLVKRGALMEDTVCVALLSMYASCGMLVEAQQVFDEMPVHEMVSWNSIMAGYARLEKDDIVLNLFDRMVEEGLQPDLDTAAIVLESCTRSGHKDQTLLYFKLVSEGYSINLRGGGTQAHGVHTG